MDLPTTTTNAFQQSIIGKRSIASYGGSTTCASSSIYDISDTTNDNQSSDDNSNNEYEDNNNNNDDDDDEDNNNDGDDNFTDEFFREAERDANRINYPKGKPNGFYVTKQYTIPIDGFNNLVTATAKEDGSTDEIFGITKEEVVRLDINGKNLTLPIALMLLDKDVYPSMSRARKSCRLVTLVTDMLRILLYSVFCILYIVHVSYSQT
jgi:hypothetical protein